jgi:hypothetical protein
VRRLREWVEGLLPSPGATILLSLEERVAALTRLYAEFPKENGYRGDTSNHDAVWQWAQELAIRKVANTNR